MTSLKPAGRYRPRWMPGTRWGKRHTRWRCHLPESTARSPSPGTGGAQLADWWRCRSPLAAADGNGVILQVDGVTRTLRYSDIGAGRVQVEFGRPGADDVGDDRDGLVPSEGGQGDDRGADATDSDVTWADGAAGGGADEEGPDCS